jgi:restriction system protein
LALWVVKAGSRGEQEQSALEFSVVTIGWNDLPDLSNVKTRDELKELYTKIYPAEKEPTVANRVGQIWAFISKIQVGDLVVLPLKLQTNGPRVAIGRIEGKYAYRTDLSQGIHHVHPVKWLKTDFPRAAFDQDLLYSFGAFMTVCQVSRHNAEARIRKLLEGKLPSVPSEGQGGEEQGPPIDVVEVADEQILALISQKFKGHALARLVEAVLQAQGYFTERSEPGADGGVDIQARKGSFGFDGPGLCVQVKSEDSRLDVGALRELRGNIDKFKGDTGLLVSWGGFKRSVREEARLSFFKIRLWGSRELVDAMLDNYDNLPVTLKEQLPLKRIWAPVLQE